MKWLFAFGLLLACPVFQAQDRVYLTNGELRIAKVLEIGPEYITIVPLSESGAPFVDANETLLKRDVILIEYKNGLVELYSLPSKSLVYNADGTMRKQVKERDLAFNFASVNTLAICNSDISFFYERLTGNKALGFGMMAAYNFNKYVNAPNLFMAVLSNAKKNYDLGAFFNIYPGRFRGRTSFYIGAMMKYTQFAFSRIEEEKTGTAVNINYIPAKGSQLATLVHIGTHSFIGQNLFFKTMVGFGAFRLKGDYKQQYNYVLNRDRDPRNPAVNYSVLPKMYLALNFGFSF